MKPEVQLRGVVALAACVGLSAAEPHPPIAAPHPIFAPPTPPPATPTLASVLQATAPARAISPEMAARLAAIASRYVPAGHAGSNAATAAAARTGDSPTPGILRMSPFLVAEKKERPLDERKILTAKGEEALAMHRYITEADRALNFFTLPLYGTPKEARAVMMLREQQRLDDMARFQNLVELTRLTSPRDAVKLQQASDAVFMREPKSGR